MLRCFFFGINRTHLQYQKKNLQHTPAVRTHDKFLTYFTLEMSASCSTLWLRFPRVKYSHCLQATGIVQRLLKISGDLCYIYPRVESAGCGANWYLIRLLWSLFLASPRHCRESEWFDAAALCFPGKKGCCSDTRTIWCLLLLIARVPHEKN